MRKDVADKAKFVNRVGVLLWIHSVCSIERWVRTAQATLEFVSKVRVLLWIHLCARGVIEICARDGMFGVAWGHSPA